MKGGKQKHITDGNLRQKEREENHNKMIANEKPSKRVMQLRKQLEETQQKLKRVTVVSNQELKELDQDLKKAKEAIRFRIMKVIYTQKNKNFEVFEKYQEEVDENQRWIDEYRSANEILRDTLKELPKEIADLKIANQTMEKANRDVAGHLEVLKKASEKLQSEKDRLLATSEKLKNEHIPRYRQQILRGELHFEAESKAKNIYRDCLIETMKKIEQSRQKDLIEDVFALFSEKEGDVNTEFVAKFLTDHSDDSSTDSYSDSDKCNDYE
ncbi:unnamed protein product [Pseudo-nitzschia multistriata]|uniref:Uncharacterized protein n=1 Tax=Pseudo-nitzschia multistriata TaxID=183589 RepID=A0A448Z2A8_9STRA|nr:unnamed protein product [Pseudo-nitzschia multistriata]